MFGHHGAQPYAILLHLEQLARLIAGTLPAKYADTAAELRAGPLRDRMISAVAEHYRQHEDRDTAASPSIALRVVEHALHKALDKSCRAAEAAKKHGSPQQAELAQAYCDYLREIKRYVSTQSVPHHFDLAGLESAKRHGTERRVDDGKTSTNTLSVAGGGKISNVVSATGAVDLIGSTSDFIDIDGDCNHIRISGVKLSFSLTEGFNTILALYAQQSLSGAYFHGSYTAHPEPRRHYQAVYQNYIQHPSRTDLPARFWSWLLDRSADPSRNRLRISTDQFFSELQRFLSGVESLSTSESVPRHAKRGKVGVGRKACELHTQARRIDTLVRALRPAPKTPDLPSLAQTTAAAIPLRRDEMREVFTHLDAAEQATSAREAAEELAKAGQIVDGLIEMPDVPPLPGGANQPGALDQEPAYWHSAQVGASLSGGARIGSAGYEKALKAFQALAGPEARKATKPGLPRFNPSLDFKLETQANFRTAQLQRLHINPHKALLPEYLVSKPALLRTMNRIRRTLAAASPDAPHPHLAYLDSYEPFADLRERHRHPGASPAGQHPKDAWLEGMLARGTLAPEEAAARLHIPFARAARQMASFMFVESAALHATPGSAESREAVALINDAFWQGRHTIAPASATREEIDDFLGLTRGLIALACNDVCKTAALVTDAAARQRQALSPQARQAFDEARMRNAGYARFLASCFAKGNDLGNEFHARHAVVLQPGPSDRDDFTVTMTLPSLKLPVLDTAVTAGSRLAQGLGPVTDNLPLTASVTLTYQSSVFDHPAPLPRAGSGTSYTAAGKLSVLLGSHLPALFHAVHTGQVSARAKARQPGSARLANHLLDDFAGQPDFPADLGSAFEEEIARMRQPESIFGKLFHALTGSETSGVTVRKFRHPGAGQPSLVRDLCWWMETRGSITVMPEVLAYFQPGASLKAGGSVGGVRHVTLAHRLGNDPFYNSMNFVKTGGLNAALQRDPQGRIDFAAMQALLDEKDETCRSWFAGAVPGSLGAVLDNYQQLLDFARRGGPRERVPGNPLDILQHPAWRDILENAHAWSRRDPRNETPLEELDAPGPLQRLFEDMASARPLSGADRRRLQAMSAQERMHFLVAHRPDILQTVFDLYSALNTANIFVKNVLGYGPAVNSFFGEAQEEQDERKEDPTISSPSA
ncbi:hypothetical protein GT347_16200 [Xylophilus rhododendri]|uniref:Uncharacterized protein n=1 Tax=Xylophilus rhododendri TaxID=2697032 RepID=A0A857J5W8_9BURK|nr:hypothetical protein [Xylophilus rhododendri]QHI99384.1 hypothetical protein GT347_16200 [Xylophilus rhododendri]